jgi:hypothetical protein
MIRHRLSAKMKLDAVSTNILYAGSLRKNTRRKSMRVAFLRSAVARIFYGAALLGQWNLVGWEMWKIIYNIWIYLDEL